jgi:hypothetical protein
VGDNTSSLLATAPKILQQLLFTVGLCVALLVVSFLAGVLSSVFGGPRLSVLISFCPNPGRDSSSGSYRKDHFPRSLYRNVSTVRHHGKRDHHLILGGLRIGVEDSACFFDFHKCRQAHHNLQGVYVVIQVALHGVSAPSEVKGFYSLKPTK